ncbi:MAG TPA: SLC13 family permease [Anaerolineales bacterium]|nr:SLC13 family permease [Anaerolineales bacterium]
MTFQILFVLILILSLGALLISERLRPDVGALLLLVILGLTGLVSAGELFSGFSRSAVITIIALFIITRALEQTGATRVLGQHLNRLAGGKEARAILVIMVATALLSLVMNTIAAAAVLLPAVIGITRQSDLQPSKLLIPLSFAALLGGMATVYTTANILVSSALAEQGFQPYGVLDFIPVGLPMGIAGILFIVFFGRRLLPEHGLGGEKGPRRVNQSLSDTYKLADSVNAVYVIPGSGMAGLSLVDGGWGQILGLNVVGISRGGKVTLAPSQSEEVIEGDVILFTGPLDEQTARRYGLFFTDDPDWKGQFISEQISLVEVVLAPRSKIAGKTLRDIHFREKFELSIIAIWREGTIIREKLANIPLKFGDTLLLQGSHARINLLRKEPDFLVLEEDIAPIASPKKALLAVGLTSAAMLLPAFNVLPIAEAAFAAATFLVVFNCVDMDDAYASIEWKAVFLISGMLPLGTAMANTGTAAFLGNLLIGVLGRLGPLAIAGGIFILTTLLTQVMSGQATAVILAPIAIAASQGVGVDPRSMAMAVAMGCSMAFLTPFGHATNLLVMGPGGYTVKDYTRVGWPLSLILFVVMLASLYLFWGI